MSSYVAFVICTFCVWEVLGQDDCAGVESGLTPILEPCTRSVLDCVTSQNLPGLGAIFCLPQAEMQFNNFKRCTNANFTNQLFGALCGGLECMSTCPDGAYCYDLVSNNNGTRVFEECNCASPKLDQQCPSVGCKQALEELLEDVGCCTNSLLYAFYLNQCVVTNGTLFTQNGLARLFNACNVIYPESCTHPFSNPMSSAFQFKCNHIILFLLIIIGFIVTFV